MKQDENVFSVHSLWGRIIRDEICGEDYGIHRELGRRIPYLGTRD